MPLVEVLLLAWDGSLGIWVMPRSRSLGMRNILGEVGAKKDFQLLMICRNSISPLRYPGMPLVFRGVGGGESSARTTSSD